MSLMSARLGIDDGEDRKQSKKTKETSPDVVKVATETLRNSAKSFQKAVAKEVSKFTKAKKDLEDLVQKLGLDSFDEFMDEMCEIKVGGELIATRTSVWAKSPVINTLLSAAKKENKQTPPELDLDPRVMLDVVEYLRWNDIRCLKSIKPYTLTRYFGYLGLEHPDGHLLLNESSSIRVTTQERKHFESWFKLGKLLYQGSRDGFRASTFHSKCDNKGPTITLVRVGTELGKIHIFGGYNPANWQSGSSYSAVKSCLFSLRSQRHDPCLILPKAPNGTCNVYNSSGHLPTFGGNGAFDLVLYDNCNTANNSSSRLGKAYQEPSGTSEQDKCLLLAGSNNFCVNEIEVWTGTELIDLFQKGRRKQRRSLGADA